MKVLCLYKPRPGVTFEQYLPHLEAEFRHAWQAHSSGLVQEVYSRQGRPVVAMLLECKSLEEAERTFADFPLVKAGLIDIEAISLDTMPNWQMLFVPKEP